MESTGRKSDPNLKQQLFENSRSFSFNQAYRLIRLLLKEELGDKYSDEEISHQIRIRPDLSLQFPSSDIVKIEEMIFDDKPGYQITVTFLGLYGTSSPLPTFYTEDLFEDENDGNPLAREFIDIFNNHLYQLFFKIWNTHRLSFQIFEANNQDYQSYLYNMGGLGDEKVREIIPNQFNAMRYIGLMGHLPRSALGLRILLIDLLQIKAIEIFQCRTSVISIPIDQQLCLGLSSHVLGDNTHIGDRVTSANEAFTVKVGPIDYTEYKNLIPGSERFNLLNHLVSSYIDQPLSWDIELSVRGDQLSSTGLGTEEWNSLGHNTWLFADGLTKADQYSVTYN